MFYVLLMYEAARCLRCVYVRCDRLFDRTLGLLVAPLCVVSRDRTLGLLTAPLCAVSRDRTLGLLAAPLCVVSRGDAD